MKVLHKAKQLLQGFVLPTETFHESRLLRSSVMARLRKKQGFLPPAQMLAMALWSGTILALVLNVGVSTVPAMASNCQVGSSSACPATSPQEIYNLYGTTSDGTYWLRVNNTATQVYLKMNRTGSNDGAWVLLMKGTRGTGNFGYDSTYFTSNSTTLNTSSLSDDVNTDAKFGVYNNLQVTKLLAVLRNDTNGLISNQGDISSNSFGGHVWLDALSSASTAQSVLANYTNRNS
jgi:hypothetical protein